MPSDSEESHTGNRDAFPNNRIGIKLVKPNSTSNLCPQPHRGGILVEIILQFYKSPIGATFLLSLTDVSQKMPPRWGFTSF